MRLSLPWPDLASFPPYGLVRTGQDFDDILARHAVKHGARLRECHQRHRAGPRRHRRHRRRDRQGRRRERPLRQARADLPRTAGGRRRRQLLTPVPVDGRPKRDDRPMGVAVRTYYTSPRHDDDYLESWLELWSTDEQRQAGAAARLRLDLRRRRRHLQRRPRHPQHLLGLRQDRLQGRHAALGRHHARGVDLQRRDHGRPDPRRRPADGLQPPAALRQGLLLVGDAGGMVNPFNGEGIAYAMESGRPGRRGHRPGLRPRHATPAASACCSPTPGS